MVSQATTGIRGSMGLRTKKPRRPAFRVRLVRQDHRDQLGQRAKLVRPEIRDRTANQASMASPANRDRLETLVRTGIPADRGHPESLARLACVFRPNQARKDRQDRREHRAMTAHRVKPHWVEAQDRLVLRDLLEIRACRDRKELRGRREARDCLAAMRLTVHALLELRRSAATNRQLLHQLRRQLLSWLHHSRPSPPLRTIVVSVIVTAKLRQPSQPSKD